MELKPQTLYSRFNDPLEALMMQFEIQDADKSEKGHRLISQCTWLYFGVLDLLRNKMSQNANFRCCVSNELAAALHREAGSWV